MCAIKWGPTLGSVLVCMTLAGCTVPTVEQPVGEAWSADKTKSLVGVWMTKDDHPLVVNQDDTGILRVASLDFSHQDGQYKLQTADAVLRQLPGADLVFLRAADEEHYSFLQVVEVTPTTIRLRAAASEVFEEAVRHDNQLGQIREVDVLGTKAEQVHLNVDAAKLWALLDAAGLEKCFPSELEMVLRRATAQPPNGG